MPHRPPPLCVCSLIHTVDHVEGYLRPNYDALDAFLCHTWAVTVTGTLHRTPPLDSRVYRWPY